MIVLYVRCWNAIDLTLYRKFKKQPIHILHKLNLTSTILSLLRKVLTHFPRDHIMSHNTAPGHCSDQCEYISNYFDTMEGHEDPIYSGKSLVFSPQCHCCDPCVKWNNNSGTLNFIWEIQINMSINYLVSCVKVNKWTPASIYDIWILLTCIVRKQHNLWHLSVHVPPNWFCDFHIANQALLHDLRVSINAGLMIYSRAYATNQCACICIP